MCIDVWITFWMMQYYAWAVHLHGTWYVSEKGNYMCMGTRRQFFGSLDVSISFITLLIILDTREDFLQLV